MFHVRLKSKAERKMKLKGCKRVGFFEHLLGTCHFSHFRTFNCHKDAMKLAIME